MADDIIFTVTYTGPRWRYGLRYRSMQIGAQPKGFIIGTQGPRDASFPFGSIEYPRRLSDAEVEAYELTLIATTNGG